jgi:thioredoxin 1
MSVIEVNAADWEKEILQSDTLVLVDFWHEKCTWCKRLAPIYEEVAKENEGTIKFTKVNVLSSPENRQIALDSGVMGTPTIVVFCEGRSVSTAVGFQPKEQLQQLVQDMIEKHEECIKQSTELKT